MGREAKKIKEHYEILHQIPVLLDMGRYSQIGIITKDTIAGMELVRSIILQIALCNCYTEVKIGCIYTKIRLSIAAMGFLQVASAYMGCQ